MDTPSHDDFRRLEAKVDKLTDAVMRLVLVEERQTNQGSRIGTVEQRLTAVEITQAKTDQKVERWINRGIGVWAVAVVLFTVLEIGAKLWR